MPQIFNRRSPATRAYAFASVLSLAITSTATTFAQVSPPAPAAKPAPVSAAAAADARKKLQSGQKLLKQKKWNEARVDLEASYALDPKPATLRSIAEAFEGAGRFSDAYASYEKLLHDHDKQLLGHEKKALGKTLEATAKKTGLLTVNVQQPDAKIEIDGIAKGNAPLAAPIRLDPGEHKIRVSKARFQTTEQSVTITATQTSTIDINLVYEVVTATIVVREASGKPVRVVVDDVEVGTAPWDGNLSPGTYKISLVGEGVASEVRDVKVVLGQPGDVTLEAKTLLGHLAVVAPPGATVRIGGKKIGKGKVEKDLEPGEYDLQVTQQGFVTGTRTITIEANKTRVEEFTLEPIAVAPPPPVANPYVGFYGRFAVYGAVSTGNGATPVPRCDDTGNSCDTQDPLGGGAALHLGYGFGLIGIELATSFQADYAKTIRKHTGKPGDPGVGIGPGGELTGNYAREDTLEYITLGAFVGPGLRLTTRGETARFTLGAAVGGVWRESRLHRISTTDEWNPKISKIVPGLSFDLGLLLGSTPGVKFLIGATARLEMAGAFTVPGEDSVPGNDPDGRAVLISREQQDIRSGTQFYFGPVLGIHFGH